MIIKKQQLQSALEVAINAIQGGEALNSEDCFIFYHSRLYAISRNIFYSVKLDTEFEELHCAVKAREFLSIITQFDENIKIESDKDKLRLESGNAKVTISFIDFDFESMINRVFSIDETKFISLFDGFTDCLRNAIFENKSKYSGVFASSKNIYSSDGYLLNSVTTEKELNTFFMSNDAAGKIADINPVFYQVALNDNFIYFKNDNETIVGARLLDADTFPIKGVKSILEKIDIKKASFDFEMPEAFFDVIKKAQVFCMLEEKKERAILTFTKSGLIVSSKSIAGTYEESIKFDKELPIDKDLQMKIDIDLFYFMRKSGSKAYVFVDERPRILFVSGNVMRLVVAYAYESPEIKVETESATSIVNKMREKEIEQLEQAKKAENKIAPNKTKKKKNVYDTLKKVD